LDKNNSDTTADQQTGDPKVLYSIKQCRCSLFKAKVRVKDRSIKSELCGKM